jgi:peptidylprolyl isomerase
MDARRRLEEDILWKRVPGSPAAELLIEEVGKFGTTEGLYDLMVRYGVSPSGPYRSAITMAVARFAIRGITNDDAIQFCLRQTRPPDQAPWQAVYALMRIGDHPLLRTDRENIALLLDNADPLVRMHTATLLGKLRSGLTGFEKMVRLADHDPDWRVRVSVLRALASANPPDRPLTLELFRRQLLDPNPSISVTAAQVLRSFLIPSADSGEAGRRTLDEVRRITINESRDYPWQLQGECAVTYARLTGTEALGIVTPGRESYYLLHAQLLRAMAETASPDVVDHLVRAVQHEEPAVAVAALQGLQTIRHAHPADPAIRNLVSGTVIGALQESDVAVVATAAAILGDSLFSTPSPVTPLLDALSRQKLPDDIEAMIEIIAALGRLRDGRAVLPLVKFLETPDRTIQQAAVTALGLITGADYRPHARRDFEPLYVDYDFPFLRSLPDTVRVRIETVRGEFTAELYKDAAPFTVMSFLKLASRRGFFRGVVFHRVVPNFVVQGGDPRGDGWGGPGYTIRSEFTPIAYDAAVIGMASAGKDTEGSQWFVTHSPQPHLDGRYTVFGRVVEGFDVVQKIQIDDRILDIVFPAE